MNTKTPLKAEQAVEVQEVAMPASQPIVVTSPTYNLESVWVGIFGDTMITNFPDETRIVKAWEQFGQILGQSEAMRVKYQTAGLKESSKRLKEEVEKQRKSLEERTVEIIGYPKIADHVIPALQGEARKVGKHLNQYKIESYPHLPPPQCVDAMQKAKPFFDSFEIWAVEDKPLDPAAQSDSVKRERAFKDPVIVGYNTIDVTAPGSSIPRKEIARYFVASWGDDIPLGQVLGAPQLNA